MGAGGVLPRMEEARAVVTGGTSGPGLAMVQALLRAGAEVMAGARPAPSLDTLGSGMSEAGRAAWAPPMGVRETGSVAAAAALVQHRWRAPDLLVNNAGVGMRTVNACFLTTPVPFHERSGEGFRDVIATHLRGYVLTRRAFVRQMHPPGRGRVVSIAVNPPTMHRRGFMPYGPSLAGAGSLALIMAEQLRPHGIAGNQPAAVAAARGDGGAHRLPGIARGRGNHRGTDRGRPAFQLAQGIPSQGWGGPCLARRVPVTWPQSPARRRSTPRTGVRRRWRAPPERPPPPRPHRRILPTRRSHSRPPPPAGPQVHG